MIINLAYSAKLAVALLVLVAYCEFIVYYVVIYQVSISLTRLGLGIVHYLFGRLHALSCFGA